MCDHHQDLFFLRVRTLTRYRLFAFDRDSVLFFPSSLSSFTSLFLLTTSRPSCLSIPPRPASVSIKEHHCLIHQLSGSWTEWNIHWPMIHAWVTTTDFWVCVCACVYVCAKHYHPLRQFGHRARGDSDLPWLGWSCSVVTSTTIN